ncbi:anti-sigma-I factor RsgI family protein [Gracilibacillus sp. D59]|uniref:anti-sigma-I factor RsgI family protein n=1 Tax=Gracilibacillus sp. D59 TaxID=3457434 RepID=UPI003FCE1805
MKRGIVVEHKLRYTIVMDKNGVFHKAIPIKDKEIGMETFYQQKESVWQSFFMLFKGSIRWKIVPMVLMCLLLLSPLYLWVADNNAYAVVSIDINPSMNITIDENYQVIDVEPMNDDAEQLMDILEVKNHTIKSLTDEIFDLVTTDSGTEEKRPVLMAVSYFNDQEDHQFEDELGSYYQQQGYQVAIYEVSKELRTQSEAEHVSMNELTAQTLGESVEAEVKQISTESDTSKPSLDNEERELIENFYNHNKQEQEDKDRHEENVEEIEETKQEKLEKETNDFSVLPVHANDRAKERKPVNNGNKKNNHGQKVSEKAKEKKDNKGQKVNTKAKKKEQSEKKHKANSNKHKNKHNNKKSTSKKDKSPQKRNR